MNGGEHQHTITEIINGLETRIDKKLEKRSKIQAEKLKLSTKLRAHKKEEADKENDPNYGNIKSEMEHKLYSLQHDDDNIMEEIDQLEEIKQNVRFEQQRPRR